MKHFISIKINYGDAFIIYNRNNFSNSIGDFSVYRYSHSERYWNKHRYKRGKFAYNKKPHYEIDGYKAWYCRRWYESYEEYMMAVME